MNYRLASKYYIIFDQGINSLINFILTIFISRYLGISGLGVFNLYFSIVIYSQIISNAFSFETLIIYYSKVKKNFLSYNFYIFILSNILFIFLIYLINTLLNLEKLTYFFYLYIFIYNFKIFLKKIIISNEKTFLILIASIFNLLLIILYIYFFLNNIENIQTIFRDLFILEMIIIIIFIKILNGNIKLIKINIFKKYFEIFFFRSINNLILGTLSNAHTYLMPYIILFYFDNETVGIYRTFISILGILHIFIQSFENIYPKYFYLNKIKKIKIHIFIIVTRWTAFFISIFFIIYLILDKFLELIYFTKIGNNQPIFFGLCIYIIYNLFNAFFSYIFRVTNKLNLNTILTFSTKLISLTLLVILLRYFGKYGFLYSTLLDLFLLISFFYLINKKFLKFKYL